MKKIIVLFSIAVLFVAPIVSAHVLKSDGSIGIQLHLDPDDDPIINQPANFDFEISDKDQKFVPANCDCSMVIMKGGQKIFSSSLAVQTSADKTNSAMVSYTFTEKAIYNVIVSGTPKTANAFQPFSIQFDVRISREEGEGIGGKSNSGLVTIGFVVVAIIVGGVLFYKRK